MKMNFIISASLMLGLLSMQSNYTKNKTTSNNNDNNNNNTTGPTVSLWVTKGDKSALLQKQSDVTFGTANNTFPTIEVDSTQSFQPIDGFGYALTGGSAYVINKLSAADKASLLEELFGAGANSIGVS